MAITWSKTPFMEKLNLNGTEAYFADKEAREHLETLESAFKYIGVAVNEVKDGDTTNPILVYKSGSSGDTQSVTAVNGNIVSWNDTSSKSHQFIFNGTAWCRIGTGGQLKAFAYVDKGTASYTPGGSVVFCNATMDLCVGAISLTGAATGNYTPAGTITDGQVVAAGSVDVSSVKATGTVSLTGVKPAGTVDLAAVKAAGTVTAPDVTLGCTTDTVTTHSFAFCGTTHVLSITDNTAQTLVSGVCVSCVAAPTFCGTGMEGTAAFCGSELTGDAGFCGTGMEGTATFCGSCTTVTGMGFCGTAAALCLGVAGCTAETKLTGAAFSNVSGVSFSGCAATIEVSPAS